MKSVKLIAFFCEDSVVGLDGNARDLEACWLKEDELEGFAIGQSVMLVLRV